MKKICALLALLLFASPAFPCWKQFQKDAKHTGEVCDITIETPLCIKHKFPAPGGAKQGGQPLTDDKGFMYINGGSKITKFDPSTGLYVWSKTGYTTNAPGMIHNNTVIYAYNNTFRAYNLDTGNVVWDRAVAGMTGQFYTKWPGVYIFECFPTLANGRIYSGTNAGEVVVVNADNGDTIKVISGVSTNELLPAPAVDDNGIAYIGSRDGWLYAVDTVAGTVKWKAVMGGQVFGAASIDSTGVYIIGGSSPAYVYKFNKDTGAVIWKYLTGSWANGSGALYGDSYFVASDDRNVYRFDKTTGTVKWKVYVEDNLAKMSCIVICAKVYILGCIDKLIMIDANTGVKDFVCHTLDSNFTNIGYANGELFFTSNDGFIYQVGKCDPSCGVCTCDSHKVTPETTPVIATPTFTPYYSTPTSLPTQEYTPTPVPTSTITGTATRTVTKTLTFTRTLPPTSTSTPLPTATVTATRNPCLDEPAPQFTVKMIFNPESTDNIIFEITSSVELMSPPVADIYPHGNLDENPKTVLTFTAEPVPGKPKEWRVLYPKQTGFGDIDSVVIKAMTACGAYYESPGDFTKSVIPGLDVKIFKNVIKPDQGERCIIHYKVYNNDRITIKIYDRNGRIIKTLLDGAVQMTGEYDVIWNGKMDDGSTASSGIYTAVVESVYYTESLKISVLR